MAGQAGVHIKNTKKGLEPQEKAIPTNKNAPENRGLLSFEIQYFIEYYQPFYGKIHIDAANIHDLSRLDIGPDSWKLLDFEI